MRRPAALFEMNRPRVLVTCASDAAYGGWRLRADYAQRLCAAGAAPYMSPILAPELAAELLAPCQGLVLSGGGDADPARFGQRVTCAPRGLDAARDAWEVALIAAARQRGLPMLAICRGLQLVNLYLGGGLIQDLPPGPVEHDQQAERYQTTHVVRVTQPQLQGLLGRELPVNSHHHQACSRLAAPLTPAAFAADGVLEAAVATDGRFFIGVQWHPECLDSGQPLFAAFVQACRF